MNGTIIDYLQLYAETALLETLENIAGAKDILIEPPLIKCLDNVAGVQKLRNVGVGKIFRLENSLPPNSTRKCVFIMRSSLTLTKQVCSIITSHPHDREFYLLGMPRLNPSCISLLESEGVYGLIRLIPLPISLIPIDDDTASLEDPSFYQNVFLHQDTSPLSSVATSLCQIEDVAKIGQVAIIGNQSHQIWNQWDLLRKNRSSSTPKMTIDHLILFDRDQDYVSLMATQMSYSAILDDLFGLKSGKCLIPKSVTKKEERQINFRDSNPILSSIRDKHISSVFGFLSAESKKLMSKAEIGTPQSISGLKNFVRTELGEVAKLRNALALHVSICEEISAQRGEEFDLVRSAEQNLLQGVEIKSTIDIIKECICAHKPWDVTLRLICLLSLVHDGIPNVFFTMLKSCFLHQYGFKYLSLFQVLERIGILSESIPVINTPQGKGGSMISRMASSATLIKLKESNFLSRSRKLGLLHGEREEAGRTHNASFIFNNLYIPLVARVLECVSLGTIDQLSKVLGSSFSIEKMNNVPPTSPRNILIYFVGGASFGEMSAVRLIAKLQGINIFMAATDVCGGSRFLNTLGEF